MNPFREDLSDDAFEAQFARNICYGVLDEKAIIGISDHRGRIVYANGAFERISQYDRGELIGKPFSILNSGLHDAEFFAELWRTITRGKIWRGEICNRAKDGSLYWVDTTIVPIVGQREKVLGYASIRLDITARKMAQGDLVSKTRLLESVKECLPGGLAIFDPNGRLVDCNDMFLDLMAVPKALAERPEPLSMPELAALFQRRGDLGQACQRLGELRSSRHAVIEHQLFNGKVIEIRFSALPEGGHVSTYQDVTSHRSAQRQMAFLADHDALTSLCNRRSLRKRLPDLRTVADPSGRRFGLLLIDLDGFKLVNDNLGHPVGDKLLVEVAARLRASARSQDVIARIGGDEFAIIIDRVASDADLDQIAARLIAALNEPFKIGTHEIVIGASIGASIFPEHGKSSDQLMKKADIALYHAKENGRNCFQPFNAGIQAKVGRKFALERELRSAVSRNEFVLAFQPQHDLTTGDVVAVESLIRWQHPDRGLLLPGAFIELAETAGLIDDIGKWVIEMACCAARDLPADVTVGINVSPSQIWSGSFVSTFERALQASGIRASRIEVEVTENAVLRADAKTLATFKRLGELGSSLAMDDFGAGYSSLSTLYHLPFHKIKIDRAFISRAPACRRSAALVSGVASIAESLGMKVTAEGVETAQQRDVALSLGCDWAQGYFFSRPVSLDQVSALYRDVATL